MHAALMNCRRVMTLLACAMKPEHLGGCSQSVHSGVAPDCSGATFYCSLGYDACCSGCNLYCMQFLCLCSVACSC